MNIKEKDTYRKLVKLLTENFTKEELEILYIASAETGAAIAQAIMSRRLADKFEADHVRCSICGECVTCNIRPCRDGEEHKPLDK
jgi:hypothetical protein